jgi:hypothetical protein
MKAKHYYYYYCEKTEANKEYTMDDVLTIQNPFNSIKEVYEHYNNNNYDFLKENLIYAPLESVRRIFVVESFNDDTHNIAKNILRINKMTRKLFPFIDLKEVLNFEVHFSDKQKLKNKIDMMLQKIEKEKKIEE